MNAIGKVCGGCRVDKPVTDFNACRTGRLGLHNHCRVCQKACKRRYYLLNRDKELALSKERGTSPAVLAYRAKRYATHRDRLLAENRALRATPTARARARINRNQRYHTNPSFRLAVLTRQRIRCALKKGQLSASFAAVLGCTIPQLRAHLERQFKPGMSWDNYGYRGWHVDHVQPCDAFDLTVPAQLQACSHFSNLQPLWMLENMAKQYKVAAS